MRRILLHALLGVVALQLAGCGFVIVRTARHIYSEYTKEEKSVDAALARYQQFVLQADSDKIVSMYAASAELSVDSGTAIVGRESLRAFFNPAPAEKLLEFELKAATTTVTADSASQRGTYRQKTVGNAGESKLNEGHFEADWGRKPGGAWLIHRMQTQSVQRKNAG